VLENFVETSSNLRLGNAGEDNAQCFSVNTNVAELYLVPMSCALRMIFNKRVIHVSLLV